MKKHLLLFGLTAALVSCAGQGDKNAGNLVTLSFGDWSRFDPAYCYDSACGEIIQNTLETLLFYDGESADTYVPLLAAEVPSVENGGISEDGLTYTVKLNADAKFSDGKPVTAEDVEYSIERMMVYSTDIGPALLLTEPLLGKAEPVRDGNFTFEQIDQAVEATDENTVVFRLAKPFAPFLGVLATYPSAIYSREDAIARGDWDGTADTWEQFSNLAEGSGKLDQGPVGSGPFTIERYDVGKAVSLKRNDDYWREPARLERVIIQSVEDENTRIQMLDAGDADMALPNAMTPTALPQLEKKDNLTVEKASGLSLVGLFMNQNIDPKGTNYLGSGKLDGKGIPANFFSDENVRKGFATAFDYDSYIREVTQNLSKRAGTILIEGLPGYSEDLPAYTYDPEASAEYFKKAWGGEVWEKGFELPVFYNTGNTGRQRALDILRTTLQKINPRFKLEVRELAFSQILSQSAANQMTVWAGAWGADYADPHNFAQPFLQSTGNYGAQIGYKNPELDQRITEAVASTDNDRRVELYQEIARTGYEDAAFIPLGQPLSTYVQNKRIQGRLKNPMFAGDYYYTISRGE
ncbi:ABC transporter substrate-binding protein [Deinococcus cellulosilyticus]|uniref:Peptide ABC transporter substrate-binding protein n=1 Tax=Deinococcus cellulosilyticus (strain DSM 18568 / NBRC 106333 / KACC 11606 / 5516J-15) TaxID=1223518 RepID=A0A511MYV1_DEIC1|nr:ABC transporter substrate-binding protein [Deinococcus cellulosilyticus]GEM45749.1 peptide ABC transporter substrate-binding protein [Deinococcus cellulosilyticus NBRC 106333 = KACC 11606]